MTFKNLLFLVTDNVDYIKSNISALWNELKRVQVDLDAHINGEGVSVVSNLILKVLITI